MTCALCIWITEDNLQKSILPPRATWVPRTELRSLRHGGKHHYLLSYLTHFTLLFIPTRTLRNSGINWTFEETYLRHEVEFFW